jgi:hypothetical protein
MYQVIHAKSFFMAAILLALLSCNNENANNSSNQLIDSVATQLPDTSVIQNDTLIAQTSEDEVDDGESDDVRDHDYNGDYVGTDPNIKLELIGSRLQYFEGSQVKMKGEAIIWEVNPNSLIIALQPFGKNKKVTEVLVGLDGHDKALWVIYERDTFFRKTFNEMYLE